LRDLEISVGSVTNSRTVPPGPSKNFSDTTVNNNSPLMALTAGRRYAIKMEFYENPGPAVARLRWKEPGATQFIAMPASRLYTD
jgi:hypothetical protein